MPSCDALESDGKTDVRKTVGEMKRKVVVEVMVVIRG
jgi:hypothetical protein